MRKFSPSRVVCAALALLVLACTGALAAARPVEPEEQAATKTAIERQLGTGRNVALVIGISQFSDPAWRPLAGVAPEIAKVRAAFQQQGFEIDGNYDEGRLTARGLREAIRGFIERHGKQAENRLVIYVATHGYKDVADPEGYGYLIASDSGSPFRDGFAQTAYSVKELSAALTDIAAQHVFLFFNACFSGAMMPEPLRASLAGDDIRARKPRTPLSREVAEWTNTLLSLNARLILTAGSDDQVVPDWDNPYAAAIVEGLAGAGDADGDGLILGLELAQYVRGHVARETRKKGRPNDAVFAVLPKFTSPPEPRPGAPAGVDYDLQGDFVFLAPGGPSAEASAGIGEADEILRARQSRLPGRQFTECADCPVMVEMPPTLGDDGTLRRIAMARTETTFAEWDACYRELGCTRYLPDDGRGRGDRPAAGVTWQDALEFAGWASSRRRDRCEAYRLPTGDEWLAAAGIRPGAGGDADPAFADAFADAADPGRAVCWGCAGGEHGGVAAARAASLPANPLGLHDMQGNLWEWVSDDGQACDFNWLRRHGRCTTPGRVMGGSWATSADRLQVAIGGGELPRTSNERPFSLPTVGLRLACDLR